MIKLVTDSTAYVPKEIAAAMDLHVVPLHYALADQIFTEAECPEDNGVFEDFLLRFGNKAKTSQATASSFLSTFTELMRQGHEILCITMSSRMSGTYSSATMAAKTLSPDKIEVVDSLITACGMYMLIERAKQLIDSGMPLKEIAMQLDMEKRRIGTVFSVESLDALRRGGRLSLARSSVGTILNVRPVLLCRAGTIIADGVARGKDALVRELIARVPDGVKEISVMSLRSEDMRRRLMEGLQATHPDAKIYYWPVGPVLGIHLGLGAAGIAWFS